MERAFFIDKDGILVDNSQYPEIIPTDELLDNIYEGLKYIQEKGYKIIIISNQPWIAKKRMMREEVKKIFQNLIDKLEEKGIRIDDYFFCPHQSSDNCNCKKPSPLLILEAAKKHNIDLKNSFTIGDMDLDILAGKNAGTKTILVLTGRGKDFQGLVNADHTIENLDKIKEIL